MGTIEFHLTDKLSVSHVYCLSVVCHIAFVEFCSSQLYFKIERTNIGEEIQDPASSEIIINSGKYSLSDLERFRRRNQSYHSVGSSHSIIFTIQKILRLDSSLIRTYGLREHHYRDCEQKKRNYYPFHDSLLCSCKFTKSFHKKKEGDLSAAFNQI